jgi:hypothetical protein
MSGPSEIPAIDHPEETVDAPHQAPASGGSGSSAWLYGLGFLVLAGGIFLAWEYPRTSGSTSIQALDTRISRLEQRQIPSQADLAKLTSRIDALDTRASDQSQVGGRLDELSGRIEALSGRVQSAQDGIRQQTDSLAARVATLEQAAGSLDAVSDRLRRLARIHEAGIALAVGRPTGDIPGAPPALSRFAHDAPPTEVQLRLLFAQSEQAAVAAKQPDDATAPFIGRVWERAQDLVTVHRGDDVVVGNPASVTLGQAREALDAGDLKGAISVVETLRGPPRQAMSDWLAQAKALADARLALANLAGQA